MAFPTPFPAPFDEFRGRVLPEWIDYNSHMNVAFYMLVFDLATDSFYDAVGCGRDYKETGPYSTFTLEGHITYERELRVGDPIRCVTNLIGFDTKRLHYFHQMYHGEEGYLAATNELIAIHVDMSQRRSAPLPDWLFQRLCHVRARHDTLARPPQVGRRVSLEAKRPS
ncbi:MAG: thioesterase-like protein [Alphaproteobacteria bacterium]|nr:thioesterase-like protein [Alphaproteobacteria bacterium]